MVLFCNYCFTFFFTTFIIYRF